MIVVDQEVGGAEERPAKFGHTIQLGSWKGVEADFCIRAVVRNDLLSF